MWLVTTAEGKETVYPQHLLEVLNKDLFGEEAEDQGFSENEIPDYDLPVTSPTMGKVTVRRA